MSQHLTRSLHCKEVIQVNTCVDIEDSKPAFIPGPHAPLERVNDDISDSGSFPGIDVDEHSDRVPGSGCAGVNNDDNILAEKIPEKVGR